MSKYILELDSVSRGAILNTETNQWIALIETKRPDLGFDELEKIINIANDEVDRGNKHCGCHLNCQIMHNGPVIEPLFRNKYCPNCGRKLEEVAE